MTAVPRASVVTIGEAVRDVTLRLRGAGSPSARLDAELLGAHHVGRERAWLLAHPEAPLEALHALDGTVARRSAGEPVAYIRGFKEWRSMRIRTDARALIPRPETELLLDAAISEISGRMGSGTASIVAWEVATGSGAVATALALRFREALALGRLRLIASDISPEALELAAENFQAHGVESLVDLACADLLAPAGASLPRPDVVIANLPYVATDQVEAAGGSLSFEPRIALDGGPDGLAVIRRLLDGLTHRAMPAATVLLEIGEGQAEAVAGLVARARTAVERDLAGIDRIVRIDMPETFR